MTFPARIERVWSIGIDEKKLAQFEIGEDDMPMFEFTVDIAGLDLLCRSSGQNLDQRRSSRW
jgi:hypothetical protein